MNELDEIKNRIDIVELIGGYVQLKQTGRNHKACCPFHNEKTPSFVVSGERQMWHCFGACNEGGDIFSFVMKADGLSFPEAVEVLASRAGVKIEKKNFEKNDKKSRLYAAGEIAADFYHSLLDTIEGEKAKKYLTNRGLTEKTITVFNLGYAPIQKNALQKELSAHNFSLKEMEGAGLVAQKGSREPGGITEPRDLFWKRLMFPIRDISGRTVGFSARTLDKDGIPKYINTPATEIYDKSSILYGIDLAKEAVRKLDYAILVEGNMDVIASYQAGVKNVVAPSGTALTENQLKLLGRLTKNLKLAFDVDFAGSIATRRAIETAWNMGFNIKVIRIPSGKDPADTVQKNPRVWKEAVKNAQYVVDFLFETTVSKYNPTETLGKKNIAKELLPVIQRLPDEIEKDTYVKKLAKALRVEETAIRDTLVRISSAKKPIPADRPPQSPAADKNIELERNLIGLLLILPHYLDFATGLLEGSDFQHPNLGEKFDIITKHYTKSNNFSEADFLKSLKRNDQESYKECILSAENTFENLDEEKKAEEIYFCVKRIKKLSLDRKKMDLTQKIAALEATGKKDEAIELMEGLQRLLEEERSIS